MEDNTVREHEHWSPLRKRGINRLPCTSDSTLCEPPVEAGVSGSGFRIIFPSHSSAVSAGGGLVKEGFVEQKGSQLLISAELGRILAARFV